MSAVRVSPTVRENAHAKFKGKLELARREMLKASMSSSKVARDQFMDRALALIADALEELASLV